VGAMEYGEGDGVGGAQRCAVLCCFVRSAAPGRPSFVRGLVHWVFRAVVSTLIFE
jgi:hypothetical protein